MAHRTFPGSFPRRRHAHYVYEAWHGDDCIYVGLTDSFGRRFTQHMTQSDWWGRATHFKIEVVRDREEALDLEEHLIGKYQPLYNWNHTARPAASRRG
jgi:excinuclease UvrABC nuclease subunit